MNCYICGTTENLSIHAKRKHMNSMICRPCRRARYQRSKTKQYTDAEAVKLINNWNRLAKENHQRLINKYVGVK